jgi:hypothetical protein
MPRTLLLLTLLTPAVFAAPRTGYISDSWCGKNNANDKPVSAQCAKECVKNGADPVFVDAADGRVLKIANKDKALPFVGSKVRVDGAVDGEIITLSEISGSK